MKIKISVLTLQSNFIDVILDEIKPFFDISSYDFSHEKRKTLPFFQKINYRIPSLYLNMVNKIIQQSDLVFVEWVADHAEVAVANAPVMRGENEIFNIISRLIFPFIKKKKKIPILLRCHGKDFFQKYLWKLNMNNVTKIIFVQDALRKEFIAKRGYEDKTITIPNAIDMNKFPLNKNRSWPNRIGMLGDIRPRKRILSAIQLLEEIDFNGTLTIAGNWWTNDEYNFAIKKYLEVNRYDFEIRFEGHVKDLPAWFDSIGILLNNASRESTCLALLEGCACGVLPVSFNWYGSDEFEAYETFKNSFELQKIIERFLNMSDDEKLKVMVQKRKSVEARHSVDKVASQYKELFDESICHDN